jgi:hypothetical protein
LRVWKRPCLEAPVRGNYRAAGAGRPVLGDRPGWRQFRFVWRSRDRPPRKECSKLALILAVLLGVIILAAFGFSIHMLWVIAAVFFVLWLIGFAVGRGANAGSRRWYYW